MQTKLALTLPDAITSVKFTRADSNILVVTTWDGSVHITGLVEKQDTFFGQSLSYKHEAPALCADISRVSFITSTNDKDGRVFSGSCDLSARCYILERGEQQLIGQHDKPIQIIQHIDQMNIYSSSSELGGSIMTVGWDNVIKFWDMRFSNQKPAVMLSISGTGFQRGRVSSADASYPYLSVAESVPDVRISTYDLRKFSHLTAFERSLPNHIRTLKTIPNKKGVVAGSICGRVGVFHFDADSKSDDMIFRCHRHQQRVYAVNGISFSPVANNTFATCGSDGLVNFWNFNIFRKLYTIGDVGASVIGGDFNYNGTLYAYGVSDDYSKGGNNSITTHELYVHRVLDSALTPNLDYNDAELHLSESNQEENMIDFEYGTNQFVSFSGEGISKRKNIFFDQLRKSRSVIEQVKMKESFVNLETNYEDMVDFHELPQEIILEIVSYLPFDDLFTASRINKVFRSCVYSNPELTIPYKIKPQFLQSFENLNSLKFGADTFDESLLVALTDYCPKLLSLELNCSPMMKRTGIDFSTCFLSRQYVTTLTELTIRNSKKIMFPLSPRQIGKSTSTPPDTATATAMPSAASLFLDLRILRLENCVVEGGTVFGLIRFTDQLEELSLRGSDHALWNKIDFTQLKQLTSLDISFTNFTSVAEKSRLESLTTLTSLNMASIDAFPFGSSIFDAMMNNNNGLTELDVSSCRTCDYIISKSVRKLTVRNSSTLNDGGILTLFDNVPNLTYLDASIAPNLKTPVIKSAKLETLILSSCESLSEVLYTPVGMPSLTEIDVSYSKMQDFSLTSLMSACGGNLVHFNCNGCSKLFTPIVTNPTIYKNLESISMTRNYNVPHQQVELLMSYATRLQHIDVTGCDLVDVEKLRQAAKSSVSVVWCGVRGPPVYNLHELKIESQEPQFDEDEFYADRQITFEDASF